MPVPSSAACPTLLHSSREGNAQALRSVPRHAAPFEAAEDEVVAQMHTDLMTTTRGTQPELSGSKVLLRPWRSADADAVFAACQDDEIQRWTLVPTPYAHSDAVAFVNQLAPAAWEDGGATFAVVDAATSSLVGSIGAHAMSHEVVDVGYWTAPAGRGRGLTSDALRTLSRWFLSDGGAARIELVIEPANTASIRVAQAAGFMPEGLLRQRLVVQGRRADVIMYSMLGSDAPPHS